MEFKECFELLSTRPAHAHAHCEEEQHKHEDMQHYVEVDAAPKEANWVQDLSTQSPFALLRSFFHQQEARVQIYTEFQQTYALMVTIAFVLLHRGFEKHQGTAHFEDFCGGITKCFASISLRINSVEEQLKEKQQPVLAQFIRKIQLQEKEKLLLTSALLIEKMRLRDASAQTDVDESTVAFFEKSIQTLTKQHTEIILRINELIDELRVEMADLSGDETSDD